MSKPGALFKNSVYNVIYKLLDALFPLISATYLARVLLSDGIGKVAYAQNIAQYFVLAASLGIPNYGIREIARKRRDEEQTSRLFSELFVINFISTMVCVVIYYTAVCRLPYFETRKLLSLTAGLLIVFNIFNVDWFYQGQEAFSYIALRSFVVKVLSLLALFCFVRSREDYVVYLLISVLASGANYIVNMANLRRWGIRFQWSGLRLKQHLKPIFIMLGTTVAIELYTMLDTTMLGFLCSDESVGYYVNAMKLVKIVITVITAMGGVLLPHMSSYQMAGDYEACGRIVSKVCGIMFFLFMPCCIGLMLTADHLMVLLFGESFAPGGVTLRIASLLTLALGFSNLFGTQVLLTFGEEKKLFWCTAAGAVSNVLMNLFLIPLFQQNGAAAASVISEAFVTALCVMFSKKYITVRLAEGLVSKTVAASVLMGAVAAVLLKVVPGMLPELVAAVCGGVVVYAAAGIILKNPVLEELKHL